MLKNEVLNHRFQFQTFRMTHQGHFIKCRMNSTEIDGSPGMKFNLFLYQVGIGIFILPNRHGFAHQFAIQSTALDVANIVVLQRQMDRLLDIALERQILIAGCQNQRAVDAVAGWESQAQANW